MRVNTTITSVNIGCNNIGIEGAKAIAETLKINKTVIEVSLGFTQIKREGAKAIVAALKVNRAVTSMNLRCNDIESAEKELVEESIELNSSLLRHWARVAIVTIFQRSLARHTFRDSILALVPTIIKFAQLI